MSHPPLLEARCAPEAAPTPPHPFRTSPWYDPQVEHRPCQCPSCRKRLQRRGTRYLALRVILVVLGGVVLPLVSLMVNRSMEVVSLGLAGTLAIILSVVSTAAHLVLSPVRRDLQTGEPRHRPPRSAVLRVLLLTGSLLGCLCWGYLALLFLPLLPLSVIALVLVGLGLCGLCPYGALAISLVQAVRDARAVRELLPGRLALAAVLLPLLLPPVAGAAAGVHAHLRRQQVQESLRTIAATAPHSPARMQIIANLDGLQDHLVDTYLQSTDDETHALLAEAYLRLSDRPINDAVLQRVGQQGRYPIRPLWFLQGSSPVHFAQFWRF